MGQPNLKEGAPSIFLVQSENELNLENGLVSCFTIPTSLYSIIISPKSGFLRDIEIRRYIQKEVKRELERLVVNTPGILKAQAFFYESRKYKNNLKEEQFQFDNSSLPKSISIATFLSNKSEVHSVYKSILKKIFSKIGVHLKWETLDMKSAEDRKRTTETYDFDFLAGGVLSDSYPINWAVEMMFCSKMGVSYPDPSGRICKLVERYKNNEIEKNDYAIEFEKIIAEDAVVIPILHGARRWLATPDIDTSKLSPASSVIRFDLVRLKND